MKAKKGISGAVSICMVKPVVLVGSQMEQYFPLEIFRKKGIASEVVFSVQFLPK